MNTSQNLFKNPFPEEKPEYSEEYAQIIKQLNIVEIFSLDTLNSAVFKIDSIFTGQPIITSLKPFIFLFDTPVYNSAYVLTLFNKFVTALTSDFETFYAFYVKEQYDVNKPEKANISPAYKEAVESLYKKLNIIHDKMQIFYCDDVPVYSELFVPFFAKRPEIVIEPGSNVRPIILTSDTTDINIDVEKLGEFTIQNFIGSYMGWSNLLPEEAEVNITYEALPVRVPTKKLQPSTPVDRDASSDEDIIGDHEPEIIKSSYSEDQQEYEEDEIIGDHDQEEYASEDYDDDDSEEDDLHDSRVEVI